MCLLSVIVPLYNAVHFLEECIESLYRQGLPNDEFEVIIINDGSTDGSGELADKIASLHTNIHVFHQINKGVGAARNLGLGLAKGEYIHFVDSDDFIFDLSYSYIKKVSEKDKPDIICFDYVMDGKYGDSCIASEVTYYGPIKEYIRDNSIRINLAFKWLSRAFIESNKLHFFEISYSEDALFTWNAFQYQGSLMMTNAIIYSYRTNPNSMVNSRSVDHVKKTVDDFILSNLVMKNYSDSYTGCPKVITSFTHKYHLLFNRVLCVPYSYAEMINVCSRCSEIGVNHLANEKTIRMYDFLYHHPRFFFLFKGFISWVYFRHHKFNSIDYLTTRL